jgi:hypothetical protein
MMEALRSSETSVLTRTTRRNIAEDGSLRSLSNFVRQNYEEKQLHIYGK